MKMMMINLEKGKAFPHFEVNLPDMKEEAGME